MSSKETIEKLGLLARQIHDSLKEIESDIHTDSNDVSSTQKRLQFIEQLTSESATKVLTLSEDAKTKINNCLKHTKSDLVRRELTSLNTIMTEIMTTQEFQDLTGQVLKKVFHTLERIEKDVLTSLLDETTKLDGPKLSAIDSEKLSQSDVDNLLNELGF